MSEKGPIYDVELIDDLPLGTGPMRQAMPNRDDLKSVCRVSERTVAGYEVLLSHYRGAMLRIAELESKRKHQHLHDRLDEWLNKISRDGFHENETAGLEFTAVGTGDYDEETDEPILSFWTKTETYRNED